MRDLAECQGILTHIHADHARIRTALQTIRRTLRTAGSRGAACDSDTPVTDLLVSLLLRLRRHFAEEEEEGGLAEAVCQCPSLSSEVRVLVAEHADLLRHLERLVGRFREASVRRATPSDDECLLQQFAEQLQAHEAAENRLLSLAFGGQFDDEGG